MRHLLLQVQWPKPQESDIEQIRKNGHGLEDFLEQLAKNERNSSQINGSVLRNGQNDSCTFLKLGFEKGWHECSIRSFRPALCRLCLFHFEMIDPTSLRLKLIPY